MKPAYEGEEDEVDDHDDEDNELDASGEEITRHYLLGPVRIVHKRRAWQKDEDQAVLVRLPSSKRRRVDDTDSSLQLDEVKKEEQGYVS